MDINTNPIIIQAKVLPNSKKEEISLIDDNQIKIKLNTTPEKGKANKKMIQNLSKQLKISKNKIRIIKGEFTSLKTIKIIGLTKPLRELL